MRTARIHEITFELEGETYYGALVLPTDRDDPYYTFWTSVDMAHDLAKQDGYEVIA